MKRVSSFLVGLSVASAAGLLAFASGPSAQPVAGSPSLGVPGFAGSGGSQLAAIIDLKAGTHRILDPHVTVVVDPVDSDLDGFFETVLKVNLLPQDGFTKMSVVLDYEGVPTGITLNIGDSDTNDGGGGDYFSYQRDAEMQILNQTLSVFASDLGGTPTESNQLGEVLLGLRDSALKVSVADMFLSYGSNYTELDFSDCPSGADLLYALGGQPDTEGPRNYDIYVGLNRVIFDLFNPDRHGSGLARAYITLE